MFLTALGQDVETVIDASPARGRLVGSALLRREESADGVDEPL
jgi:hypothetical protein